MLLNCIECNRKISSTAKVCPQCGYINNGDDEIYTPYISPEQLKVNQTRTRKLEAFWNPILSILFLIFLFWCIYVCVFPPAWL